MVPADSRRIPRVPRYSGYHYASSGFTYGAFTLSGRSFQNVPFTFIVQWRGPTTPPLRCHNGGLGSSPVARHYWGNHYFMFVASMYEDVSVPSVRLLTDARMTVLQTAGLSHSEISGSMVICTYPKLIAAYHVLHRLREPRHPPCALSYFLSVCSLLRL